MYYNKITIDQSADNTFSVKLDASDTLDRVDCDKPRLGGTDGRAWVLYERKDSENDERHKRFLIASMVNNLTREKLNIDASINNILALADKEF
jgi:hypothetical protein